MNNRCLGENANKEFGRKQKINRLGMGVSVFEIPDSFRAEIFLESGGSLLNGQLAGGGIEFFDERLGKTGGVGDDENLGGFVGELNEPDECGEEGGIETVFGFVENEQRGRFVPVARERKPAVRVPFFHRVRHSSDESEGPVLKRQDLPWVGRGLLWMFLIVALARPVWVEEPIERAVPTRDLLLAVDLSGSMEKDDFAGESGKMVDRLTAVKEVLGEFLTEREGDRVGLVVFGNSPFLLAPFTTDLELSRQLLDETAVRMAGLRTAFGDAIGLGIRLFEDSTAPAKTMIVLTDGNDTSSSLPPIEAAKVARDRGITVYTVGMGDPETVGEEKLDETALENVAKETGGRFFLALDRQELDGVYDELNKIETSETKTVSFRPRSDLYFWPLGAALVLSLAIQAYQLLRSRREEAAVESMARVRVDPRTHELEISGS